MNRDWSERQAGPDRSGKDIRETFFRMAMNDGKTHGAGDPSLVGPEPESGAIEDQGLGWKSKHGIGFGADTITGGPEVTWSQIPTKWSNRFFDNLFKYEWELGTSPAGAFQWKATKTPTQRSRTPTTSRRSMCRACWPRTCRCASTRSTRRFRAASTSIRTSSRTRLPAPG